MRRRAAALALPLLLTAGTLSTTMASAETADVISPPRVLVWGGAYGFRHPSITVGEATMLQLAQSTGAFDATVTENPADLTMDNLRQYDVLMWVSNTGKAPMSEQQREDVMRWSSCGGGNLGIHAVLDGEYGWGEHTQLFGAQFDSHPHIASDPAARVQVEDRTDPTVAGWAGAESFELADEYYRWRSARGVPGISLPRNDGGTSVLLSLDETSVKDGIQTGPQPYEDDQPISWKRTFGEGRVFYNNMGHSESTWSDPAYQTSLINAVDWLGEIRPDAACLDDTLPLPTPTPPAAPAKSIGRACAVPASHEQSAASAPRAVTTKDAQLLGGGGSKEQTWVVDLSATRAATADVVLDLTWALPTDDYDFSVTTSWGFYGSDKPVGGTREAVVIKDVPHCAILQVSSETNFRPTVSDTTTSISVTPKARRLS